MITLDLRDLSKFSTASRSVLACCAEAASVMLWKFHTAPSTAGRWEHVSSVVLEDPKDVQVLWDEPSREVIETHGNELKATELGAEAIAMAVADALGFRVLGIARHGTGSDLVLVPKGEPTNDYYKLEVSGIARVGSEAPWSRLTEKVAQSRRGEWNRPGVAVVTRFEDVRILSEAWR